MELDADNDGNISPDELMLDFGGVHMRADIMLERMRLEDGLLGFIQQMLGIEKNRSIRNMRTWTLRIAQ